MPSKALQLKDTFMTTSVSFQALVAVTRTVEHMPINDRLVAVRVSQTGALDNDAPKISHKRFAGVLTETKTEMVLTNANLDKLLEGKPYTTEKLTAASDAFIEDARIMGYPLAVEAHAKNFEAAGTNYLTRMENGETLRMINIDYCNHMLFDDEGRVMPTGFYYDYMRGNMRNGAYDLDKVVELLKGKDYVHVLDKKALAVEDVPYYNASSGCTASLQFVLAPTQEQMEAIWEKAKTLNKRSPSVELHRAAFELDTWGLRAAGAARFDNFYETGTSYGESDDNDD